MTYRTIFRHGPGHRGPLLLVHGGAGRRVGPIDDTDCVRYHAGLRAALVAGSSALSRGAAAVDAVCAAVTELEDDPMFNAACGAALTCSGTAELDSAVMSGDGRAGAIAASKYIRNPVLGARHVLEHTSHVLIVDPDERFAHEAGLATAPRDYFVTQRRRDQLRAVMSRQQAQERHGTVGAVALDTSGHVACATSTGGMVAQSVGRVGDTALIGAGSFAADDCVAVSCTGEGEAYIRACVAHDIACRMRYRGDDLTTAVRTAYEDDLCRYGATGGTIAVTPAGDAVIAHNSDGIFAGYWTPDESDTFI